MSTTGGILLIAMFVGAHLLMHRGHGSHGARHGRGSTRPQDGHLHDPESDSEAAPNAEAGRHTHRGC